MKYLIEKINDLKIEKRAFINGRFVNALDAEIIKKKSSADQRDISGIASCKQEDVNIAVKSARATVQSRIWMNKEPQDKKKIFLNLADLMKEYTEELALLDTLETGRCYKNYFEDSIPKAIQVVRWFAESVDKFYDHAIVPRKNTFATITRGPIGVVGLITPWNDPLVPAMWKMIPALLTGNSVIIKPAEQSSFSILKVAGLAQQAGVPDGVLNVVPGIGEVAGKALALHNNVDGLFFTGSAQVGKKILEYSGRSNMKKVGLECGGKSAFIVSEKCSQLERAAKVLAQNIFYNQGQICSAPSRAIIANKIKDKFVDLVRKEMEKYIPKNPFDPDSRVGCVVSLEQKEKIEKFIQSGIESGAVIYRCKNEGDAYQEGYSVVPVIFDQVAPDSLIAQEEIFGPVLCVFGFDSINDAISLANNSRYGLAGAIWTNDLNEAYQVSRLLEAGIVHVNSYGEDDNCVPFGGFKESGIGKDKSIYAFDEYTNSKTTWMHFDTV
ncbi:aldehyde dehydrogenase family protein [Desulfobacter sp.]|uniref:aldehyde dehydrogenase family protein n=1 Tax=Desulfobacter sp. TaxID=2294 RepID=UPI003D0DA1F2